jgi:hypothetical protein
MTISKQEREIKLRLRVFITASGAVAGARALMDFKRLRQGFGVERALDRLHLDTALFAQRAVSESLLERLTTIRNLFRPFIA